MNLIKILDSDARHSVEATAPQNLLLDKVLISFRDVFEGIGTQPGEYKITMTLLQYCLRHIDY